MGKKLTTEDTEKKKNNSYQLAKSLSSSVNLP